MLGRQAFGLAAHRLYFAMPPIWLSLQRERLQRLNIAAPRGTAREG